MGVGWRLVRERYATRAFSGEGARRYGGHWNTPGRATSEAGCHAWARRYGGHWNTPGVPLVYTSAHLSLASLETLVHVQPLLPRDLFVVFQVEWDDQLMETLVEEDLPPEWKAEPPGSSSMRIGDQWFREGRSAVLAVPSALVPEEKNFLLNPRHPAYEKIRITQKREFFFDPRLKI